MRPSIRHTYEHLVSAVILPLLMLSSQDNLSFISKPKNHCLCTGFVKAALSEECTIQLTRA